MKKNRNDKEIYGLTEAEAVRSRKEFGDNSLPSRKRKGLIRQIVTNLGDPIIRILLIAMLANIVLTYKNINWVENGGILLAVIISTVVSTVSERSSERAFERLKSENSDKECIVIRDGMKKSVDISQIVVGDAVTLERGEMIPCDGKIIDGRLFADQSALNGESRECEKYPSETSDDLSGHPGSNALFRGSIVTSGGGVMICERVGKSTMFGKIAAGLSEDKRDSPLRHRLEKLSVTLSRIGYAAAALVALAYLFNVFVIDSAFGSELIAAKLTDIGFVAGSLIKAVTIAITVIVVAVPEGLPMMVSVVLSSNMRRMYKDNVLVRRGVGIETAGCMNMLFTDKTGTITSGNLSVSRIIDGELCEYKSIKALEKNGLFPLIVSSAYCNSECGYSGDRVLGGNATERAIMEFVGHRECGAEIIDRLAFSSENKYSSVILPGMTLYKGAPEKLLPLCARCYDKKGNAVPFPKKSATERKIREIASGSERVIVMAASSSGNKYLSGELTFICAVVIKDAVRKDAGQSVRELKRAGIHTVMITGDSGETARAVAAECSLIDEEHSEVLSSDELSLMSDEELAAHLPGLAVVSRALPSDKSRLVRIAESLGNVVGMTGDGINDAPALRLADVGFSMGSGRDIAKDASDIVILDDRLSSIKKAVLYGRTVFRSIRKFIFFQLTMNLAAVGVSLFGQLMGIDSPVTVIQMLWVNIIMDTLGGLAFAGEPPLLRYLEEKPKSRNEQIVGNKLLLRVLLTGGYLTAVCTAFLDSEKMRDLYGYYDQSVYFMTAFFALFIFSGIAFSFIARSEGFFVLSNIGKNKPFIIIMTAVGLIQLSMIYMGGEVFRCTPLGPGELARVLILATMIFPADFLMKIMTKLLKTQKNY